MNSIVELHRAVFGFVPKKQGTGYERLAAVVLAVLGWREVVHDEKRRPEGRRASHQLDVVAVQPDGGQRRLIVECKHWADVVGQDILDHLVGVRAQHGFDDAAVVTTESYTSGAIDVAVDNEIALLVLRPYDESRDGDRFIRRVELRFEWFLPGRSEFRVYPTDPAAVDGLPARVDLALAADTQLELGDGTLAESLEQVIQANGAPMQEGTFTCSATLPPDRWLPLGHGTRIEIAAFTWTEQMQKSTTTTRVDAKGEPVLVVEQLDEHGDAVSGRLVVDRDLYAWDIDPATGHVTPRGELGRSD